MPTLRGLVRLMAASEGWVVVSWRVGSLFVFGVHTYWLKLLFRSSDRNPIFAVG